MSAVLLDIVVGVLVDDRRTGDVLGLVGDERHGYPMPGVQIHVPAEVGQVADRVLRLVDLGRIMQPLTQFE